MPLYYEYTRPHKLKILKLNPPKPQIIFITLQQAKHSSIFTVSVQQKHKAQAFMTIPSLVTVSTTALTRCITVTMEACEKVQKESVRKIFD